MGLHPMPIQWDDILAQAKEKLYFQKEDLLYRLETFPSSLLNKLNTIDIDFRNSVQDYLDSIIADIKISG